MLQKLYFSKNTESKAGTWERGGIGRKHLFVVGCAAYESVGCTAYESGRHTSIIEPLRGPTCKLSYARFQAELKSQVGPECGKSQYRNIDYKL